MFQDKKKTIITSIIILAFVIIAAITVTAVTTKVNNDKKQKEAAAQNTPAAKKKTADTKKEEGIKAAQSGDSDKAKQLLQEAKSEYKAAGDTDNAVDADAQLYFVEHPSTPPAATSTTGN